MVKYFCDICDSEIQNSEEKLGVIDFRFTKLYHLCPICKPKFKEAKASLYDEYEAKYEALDTEYFNKIKQAILTDVDPAPVGEDTEFTFENNP